MWRRWVRVLIGGAVVPILAATACLPSQPNDPVAVRLIDGRVEAFNGWCQSVDVAMIQLIGPVSDSGYVSEDDPILWEVTFGEAWKFGRVMIGEVPDGGTESVAFQVELRAGRLYAIRLTGLDGRRMYGPLELDRLRENVYYDNDYLSDDDFAKQAPCPTG